MSDYLYPRVMYARGINRVKRLLVCDLLRMHRMTYTLRSYPCSDPAGGYDVEMYWHCEYCGKELFH